MSELARDSFRTIATIDAAAIAILAAFAGGAPPANGWLAALALVSLVLSVIGCVSWMLLAVGMEDGEPSRPADERLVDSAIALGLGGFVSGFGFLAIYGLTRFL